MTDVQWRLPPVARSAPQARRAVTNVLDEWGLSRLADTVALLVSEVVTNAVLHARTALTVRVARDGAGVRVSVSDGSSLPPAMRRHAATATTGRGLRLLDMLADSWSAEPTRTGKTVSFTVSGARDPWATADSMLVEGDG